MSTELNSIAGDPPVLAAPVIARRPDVRSVLRAAFDKARAAHVGIDIQHKYCAFGAWDEAELTEQRNLRRIAGRIGQFTAATRAAMTPVWVNHVNEEDTDWRVVPGQDKGLRALGVRMAKKMGFHPYSDEEFARRDIYGCHAQPDDVVLAKARFDGFENTRLDDVLRGRGADTLVLTGFFMDQCVLRTALTARKKGYEVVVAPNLSMAGSVMKMDRAVCKLRDNGVRVATAQTVMAEARPWM